MRFVKLTLIGTLKDIYVAPGHVASVGTAYEIVPSSLAGAPPISKKVGTLVNLGNGVNHGVSESPEKVISLLGGSKW